LFAGIVASGLAGVVSMNFSRAESGGKYIIAGILGGIMTGGALVNVAAPPSSARVMAALIGSLSTVLGWGLGVVLRTLGKHKAPEIPEWDIGRPIEGIMVAGLAMSMGGYTAFLFLIFSPEISWLFDDVGFVLVFPLICPFCGFVCALEMKLLSFVVAGLHKGIAFLITRLVIGVYFRTIICSHCFRLTFPYMSRYANGTRYCEHCHAVVDRSTTVGKVVFAFGTFPLNMNGTIHHMSIRNFEVLRLPKNIYLFSNPGFNTADRIVDVSEIYIDTATCPPYQFERFLTYIVNYPPTHGLTSINIFYRGTLDALGENLKNALQNNFPHLEKML
jgi:hypothetical protein